MSEGTHVRATVAPSRDDATVALLTVQVWPLSVDLCEPLYAHIQNEINRWLTDREVTNGDITDITAKGPMQ